jgi:hypothetical protein
MDGAVAVREQPVNAAESTREEANKDREVKESARMSNLREERDELCKIFESGPLREDMPVVSIVQVMTD